MKTLNVTTETTEATKTTDETPTEAPAKKLLLGRRVLRHLNVRSAVQTGTISARLRCG